MKLEQEEKIAIGFFLGGTMIAAIMLFYFYAFSSRQVVQSDVVPVPVAETQPAVGEDLLTYQNHDLEFVYPSKLELKEEKGVVTLSHSTPFENYGPCDMMGGEKKYDTLEDFGLTIEYVSKPLVQTVKSQSPYIPTSNFSGSTLKVSPGFIDAYSIGSLEGYAIYEGVEGCGHTVYYFPRGSKTLVVKHNMVQLLSGMVSSNLVDEFKKVPGAILKEESETLRKNILESIKFKDGSESSLWKIYRNEELGFELSYPPSYTTTGKRATNSTLGSADERVGGVFIGPLVFVPVSSPSLAIEAKGYMNIGNFPENHKATDGGIPLLACKRPAIVNNSAKIQYVYCTGEGGPAHYAYIEGKTMNIFVDGYSCGWDNTCDAYGSYPGRSVKVEDLVKILASFKFTK